MNDKAKDARLRRMASRLGYVLTKSRARHTSINNFGEYALLDRDTGVIIFGSKFNLSLNDVEELLIEEEAKLEKSIKEGTAHDKATTE